MGIVDQSFSCEKIQQPAADDHYEAVDMKHEEAMEAPARGGDRTITIPEIVPHPGTVIGTHRECTAEDAGQQRSAPEETPPVHYNALAGLTVEETESLQDYDAFPVVEAACSRAEAHRRNFP